MHVGYSLKRNFVSFFLLFLLIAATGFAMAVLPGSNHLTEVFAWPLLGDMFIPLFFMLPAVIFQERILSLAALLSSYFILFFRVSALLLYRQTFLPLDFYSFGILWEHTEHSALTAVLGKGYYWWLVPLLLLILCLVFYSCVLTWNICQKRRQKLSRFWIYLFSLLLCISTVANVCFYWQETVPENTTMYCGKLVRPIPFSVGEICKNGWQTILRHGGSEGNFFPKDLREDSSEYLFSFGVLPPPAALLSPSDDPAPPARFDKVLIIAVESLDLDYIGALNPAMPRGITPELDRLVKSYPSLTRYYSAAQPTSWGLNALLLSRLDYARDRYCPAGPTLFTLAAKQGYSTAYFSGISELFGNNGEIYQELFRPERLYFLEELEAFFGPQRKYFWGISDTDLFQCVLKQMRAESSSRFLYLVSTIDTHPPYAVTDPDTKKKDWGEPFLNSLHGFDRALGRFLREIMADPRLYNERTLIVITSDHSATHGANYLKRESYTPERIPLILITPETKVFDGIPRDGFASSIDLAPTLLPLLGGKTPNCFMGRDLREKRSFALSRTMDDQLLIRNEKGLWVVNLSDPRPETMPERAFFDFFYLFYQQ